MATTNLCPQVTEILSQSTITATLLVLPPGQLERKLYEKVAKVIQLAGGKWNRSKAGFIFPSDPRAKLGLALESGAIVDEKKLRQAFYTPAAIADEVVLAAEVAGCHVLEPSAGDGALAAACRKFGARQVDCIELEESCRTKLIPHRGRVTIGDFLKQTPYQQFERIVMNPPFTKGQAYKHVAHALKWLQPDGRLFAIVPNNNCPKLEAIGAETVLTFPAGSFKESGTMVETRLIEIAA